MMSKGNWDDFHKTIFYKIFKQNSLSKNLFLTPQAQLSLQGTFFSFLIMLNSELCAWGVKPFFSKSFHLSRVIPVRTKKLSL